MRLLYLYPEEWTGHRAREVHTLSTCAALAQSGAEVTLVTAGGESALRANVREIAGTENPAGLRRVCLSRTFGPVRSAAVFAFHFRRWLRSQPAFDRAYIIHLKAAVLLRRAGIPYGYEAHEIFAETPRQGGRQAVLHEMEKETLAYASLRVATSAALAGALRERYLLPDDFAIIPNAGLPPLEKPVGSADGPFVYAGSLADWKGLDLILHASREARVPLKIIGGSRSDWERLGTRADLSGMDWQPRVSLTELPRALAGARAGLIPTEPQTPSGRYSCPMKLFDYARCGLPVLSTALPSLRSLHPGPWCAQVSPPTREGWAQALRNFGYEPTQAEAARAWSGAHTWAHRAHLLMEAFGRV